VVARGKLPVSIRPRWETPVPRGIAGTYGDAAIAWAARELRLVVTPWQAYAIRAILRHDVGGDLIARIALLGTARQNGKSVIVRVIFGWMLDEGRFLPPFAGWRTILAAAHDAKQARIIYTGVYGDLSSIPRVREMAKGGRHGREVRLTEHFGVQVGSLTLDTVTGQPGSSRGLSAGAVAWDEMLTQRDWDMWEALSPTQSAQRSPIMLLTSTAGHADSVVLRSFYDRLVRIATGDQKPDRTFYGAWWQSEDADAGLDWSQLQRANPSLGDGRLTRQAIATEYGILPPDSWRRERLNHFVDERADSAFHPGLWAACRVQVPLEDVDGPYALGVDVDPGWSRATITASAIRDDYRVGAEVYADLRAEAQPLTAERLLDTVRAFPRPVVAIAYDSVSAAAAAFRRDAEQSALPWIEYKPAEVTAACMDMAEMIQSRRLAVDDPLLDAQIPTTAKRNVGQDGAFRFSRAQSLGPIDGVMSMTFACHAIAGRSPAPQIW
jgi:hypothetical protein